MFLPLALYCILLQFLPSLQHFKTLELSEVLFAFRLQLHIVQVVNKYSSVGPVVQLHCIFFGKLSKREFKAYTNPSHGQKNFLISIDETMFVSV
jgi:hypothetical protein